MAGLKEPMNTMLAPFQSDRRHPHGGVQYSPNPRFLSHSYSKFARCGAKSRGDEAIAPGQHDDVAAVGDGVVNRCPDAMVIQLAVAREDRRQGVDRSPAAARGFRRVLASPCHAPLVHGQMVDGTMLPAGAWQRPSRGATWP